MGFFPIAGNPLWGSWWCFQNVQTNTIWNNEHCSLWNMIWGGRAMFHGHPLTYSLRSNEALELGVVPEERVRDAPVRYHDDRKGQAERLCQDAGGGNEKRWWEGCVHGKSMTNASSMFMNSCRWWEGRIHGESMTNLSVFIRSYLLKIGRIIQDQYNRLSPMDPKNIYCIRSIKCDRLFYQSILCLKNN